jgi:ABC-type Fe3+/spermidine/putrescine transport system ATPase subunit
MNEGKVEQIGTPKDIYDRPASRFVAEFIGKANMLELEAPLEEYGGRAKGLLRTFSGPVAFDIAQSAIRQRAGTPSARPSLFIRPEKIQFVASGFPATGPEAMTLRGRVKARAFAGDRSDYLVDVNDTCSLRVSGSVQTEVPVGAEIHLTIPTADVVVYR